MNWAVLIKPLKPIRASSVYRIRSTERVEKLWVAEIVDRDEEMVVIGAWIPKQVFDNEIESDIYYECLAGCQDPEKTHPSDLIPQRWVHKIVPRSSIKEFGSKEEAEAWVKKIRITQ